jgi:circadian clock protein KaiB
MSRLVLRLYVAGDGPNSVAARANLRRLLAHCEPSTYSLEIVDCLREPIRTLQEGVLVTPTLVRLEPSPSRTIIGTLSDTTQVSEALGINAPAKVESV